MSYSFVDSYLKLESCLQTCRTCTIAEHTVNNSWWWTEELSETCSVSFPKIDLRKLVHLVGFIVRKFVTMHGHMNVEFPHFTFARSRPPDHWQHAYSPTVTRNKDRSLERQVIRRLKAKTRQDTNKVNSVNFDTEEYIDVLFSDLFRPVTQNISYVSHCG
jgi:hypothetical protein